MRSRTKVTLGWRQLNPLLYFVGRTFFSHCRAVTKVQKERGRNRRGREGGAGGRQRGGGGGGGVARKIM